MKTVLRSEAITAIAEMFKVDLSDYMDASYPDARAQQLARVAVEIQRDIMQDRVRGDVYAASLRGYAGNWRDQVAAIGSLTRDIEACRTRITVLVPLRDMALHPFLPRRDGM
jgi:hypothetical protein